MSDLKKLKEKKVKNKLKYLFDMIVENVMKKRTDYEKFNCNKFWSPIKDTLTTYDNVFADSWRSINKQLVETIMNLTEITVNGYGAEKVNENNSCIINIIKIATKEKPTIKQVLHIAVYIGIHLAINKESVLPIEYTTLTKFLHKEDVNKLSDSIKDSDVECIKKYIEN